MNCDLAREALSAQLDDEDPGYDAAAVREHLAGCVACAVWLQAAHEVTRRFRLSAAPELPDRTEQLLAAAGTRPGPRRRLVPFAVRGALVLVAVAQLLYGVLALVVGQDHAAPTHAARELGSFDLALAAGFLAAALRPTRARGMLVLVGVAALALLGTAAVDLAAAHTDPLDEAPHLLPVAGWLLLRLLSSGERLVARRTAVVR